MAAGSANPTRAISPAGTSRDGVDAHGMSKEGSAGGGTAPIVEPSKSVATL